MSDAVIKTVGRKLKYYFDVKRLEDGFDLSGVHSPQLDHPPLKSRPTLQYDGLHDRALKHYFSLPEVRVRLTKMDLGEEFAREEYVKGKLKKTMIRYNFLPTAQDEEVFPRKKRVKSAGPSTLPEYCYIDTKDGRRLKKEMIEFQSWYKDQQRNKPLKGGWPILRSVPPRNLSKGEAHRLVNAATKILIATEAVDGVMPPKPKKRPQSAPSPFELRPTPGKYTWDIHGRRHRNVRVKGRSRDDSGDSAYTTRTNSMSSDYQRRKIARDEYKPRPPPPKEEREDQRINDVFLTPSVKPHQKRRIHIINRDEPVDDEVLRNYGTQTQDNVGVQTEKRLIEEYDQDEDEVKQGDWGEYQIYVKTGENIGASTKADIKLTVYGDKGRSKEFYLDRSKRHKITFQKGKEDLFMKAFPHVGKLKKIRIGHDRTELSYAWFLESVTIYDMRDKRVYDFPCSQWLSGQDGDRNTYRVLPLTNDRAFIEKFEEESDSEDHRRRRSSSSSSSSSSSDSEGKLDKNKSTKVSILVRRSSKAKDGSESDSSTSSSSSSSTETNENTKKKSLGRPLSPLKKPEEDDFFDTRGQGPTTFTFKERVTEDRKRDDSSTTDTSTTPKHVSVDTSSETESNSTKPEQEFIHGYKVGLEAVQEEGRKKKDEENEDRKKVLRGPTIHSAAKIGSLKRVQELLQYFPEMISQRDEKGMTPLHIATKHGQLEVVKWLAVNGSSLNEETPTGYTPIHLAAMSGHVNCLMVLAALGAAITCRSADKKTPLYLAAMEGHLECVKWLIANRARLDVRDDMGRTPRQVAEEYRHKAVADFLKACEDEMKDPNSGFAQMRTNDQNENGSSSPKETKDMWKDDEDSSKLADSSSEDEKSRSSQKELEEKRKLYEEQHNKMEKTGESFLDSIRDEVES
ncbi:uncharacterized protein LOC134725544 isoform X2 [Mytilus trossulus]|uniref:uncharacterized protein LOC134725544 isoform X2 n=1 Tax=Mytilus trossulus TaxID=6551 RepID=UPI0030065492